MPAEQTLAELQKEFASLQLDYRRLQDEAVESRNRAAVFRRIADLEKSFKEIYRVSLEPLELEPALNRILDIILHIPWLALEKKGCIFLVREGSPRTLDLAVHSNLDDPLLQMCKQVAFGRCLCGRAALNRRRLFKDCIDGEHENMPPEMEPHGHHIVPILAQDRTLGVLNLYIKHEHRPDLFEDMFLHSVAGILSAVILNKQFERKLVVPAFEDSLTGLPNRQLFDRLLDRALLRARRGEENLALLYFGLDQLQQVADRYGSEAGDTALREISRRLTASVRAMDVLSRFDANDFAMLVQTVSSAGDASRLRERIGQAVNKPVVVNGAEIRIGISIGTSFFPEDGDSRDELIRCALASASRIRTGQEVSGSTQAGIRTGID